MTEDITNKHPQNKEPNAASAEEHPTPKTFSKIKDWAKVAARTESKVTKTSARQSTEKSPSETIPPELLDHPSYRELAEKLSKVEEECNEYHQQLLLTKADLENSGRRAERELANAHQYAIDKLVLDLLPIIDSLEHGLASKPATNDIEFSKKLHAGMELTLDMFLKTLAKYGIEQLNPLHEAFNPHHHEAMAVQPEPSVAPNTVLKVMQKGYLLKDRLIRPALVIVAKNN